MVYDYYSMLDNKLKYFHTEFMPYFFYPNNQPCFEANIYIIHKIHQSGGSINKGSLKTYCNNISHLIRYIYTNKIKKFSELNNELFSDFIKTLQFEKNPRTGKFLRDANQVRKIGRQSLDFLFFIAEIYNLERFIGENRSFNITIRNKPPKKFKVLSKLCENSFTHSSFPLPSPKTKRYPISSEVATKIYKHVTQTNDMGLRIRNTCLIDSLEQTGARRQEIMLLRIEDIRFALQSDLICPMLQLRTLKTKRNTIRMIPVPKTYLQNISLYIRRVRKKIIEKTIGLSHDHGFVFISHTTGKPLSADTLTTYLNKWAKEINLSGQAFAHLYRHRFITEKFKCLILEHQINNPDSFRQLLLSTQKFQQIIQQWTGHTSIESLNTYINLAYADLSNMQETIDNMLEDINFDLINQKINLLIDLIDDSSFSNQEKTNEIKDSLFNLATDLNSIKK
jgi:integrase